MRWSVGVFQFAALPVAASSIEFGDSTTPLTPWCQNRLLFLSAARLLERTLAPRRGGTLAQSCWLPVVNLIHQAGGSAIQRVTANDKPRNITSSPGASLFQLALAVGWERDGESISAVSS